MTANCLKESMVESSELNDENSNRTPVALDSDDRNKSEREKRRKMEPFSGHSLTQQLCGV